MCYICGSFPFYYTRLITKKSNINTLSGWLEWIWTIAKNPRQLQLVVVVVVVSKKEIDQPGQSWTKRASKGNSSREIGESNSQNICSFFHLRKDQYVPIRKRVVLLLKCYIVWGSVSGITQLEHFSRVFFCKSKVPSGCWRWLELTCLLLFSALYLYRKVEKVVVVVAIVSLLLWYIKDRLKPLETRWGETFSLGNECEKGWNSLYVYIMTWYIYAKHGQRKDYRKGTRSPLLEFGSHNLHNTYITKQQQTSSYLGYWECNPPGKCGSSYS